jgi:hypothetical protein
VVAIRNNHKFPPEVYYQMGIGSQFENGYESISELYFGNWCQPKSTHIEFCVIIREKDVFFLLISIHDVQLMKHRLATFECIHIYIKPIRRNSGRQNCKFLCEIKAADPYVIGLRDYCIQ